MLGHCHVSASVANWRPIVVLKITFFANVCHPLKHMLDNKQSHDQFGFQPSLGVENALIVLETVIDKSLERGFILWMTSLDLRNAFDKIEYDSLFGTLHAQRGPPHTCCCWQRCTAINRGWLKEANHFTYNVEWNNATCWAQCCSMLVWKQHLFHRNGHGQIKVLMLARMIV